MKQRNAALILNAAFLIAPLAMWAQTPVPPATPATPSTQATPAPAPTPRSSTRVMVGPSKRAYLGVNVDDVSSDRVAALKLKEERGVEVTLVDQDSPAGKAGMKEHDVILDFNGNRVEGTEQLTRMIRETPPGRTVNLGISRDGQPMQLKVTLGDRGKEMSHTWIYKPGTPMPAMPAMPDFPTIDIPDVMFYSSDRSVGAVVDNLTPQLGEYFGVKGGQGVLVKSVERGSAAESAGIKAGDVIVKVDTEPVENRSEWRRALRSRKAGKVAVTVIREKREQSLTLTLPEPRRGDRSANRSIYVETPDVDIDISNLDAIENIGSIIEREMIRVKPEIEKQLRETSVEFQKTMEREMKNLQKQLQESLKDIHVEVKS